MEIQEDEVSVGAEVVGVSGVVVHHQGTASATTVAIMVILPGTAMKGVALGVVAEEVVAEATPGMLTVIQRCPFQIHYVFFTSMKRLLT